MDESITHLSTAGDDRFPNSIVVAASGDVLLQIRNNRLDRTSPVGLFRGRIPPEVARKLLDTASAPPFSNLKSQETLVPDESFRSIKINHPGGRSTEKLFGEEGPAPAPFTEVESILERIARVVREKPSASIALAATGTVARSPTEGRRVMFTLALASVGTDTLRIAGPASGADPSGKIEVSALPKEASSLPEQKFLQFQLTDLLKRQPPETETLVEIPPQQTDTIRFDQPVEWKPGQYQVEMTLTATFLSAKKQPVFSAAYFIPLDTLTVAPH